MNAVALPLTVADIVDEYAVKDSAIAQAVAEFDRAWDGLGMAVTVQGVFVETIGSKPYLNTDTLRHNLLRSGWNAVYNRLQVDAIASANDRKRFKIDLANPPALTLENAKATFGDYLVRPRFHILRGLAEVFCALDQSYRSHSKVRIGVKGLPKRVILNGWGEYSTSHARDRFRDMVNALAALRGQPGLEWIETRAIDQAHKLGEDAVLDGRSYVIPPRYPHEKPEELATCKRGLTVRRFGNGNAHVFFDADALRDINQALAEFYGEVLPDVEPEDVKPSASTAVAKDLQFYWSPPEVVKAALDFAGITDRREIYHRNLVPAMKVLEPSCGDGRILDAVRYRGHSPFGIEYHPGRAAEARAKGHKVLTDNFLDCSPPSEGFDAVVMNPPFYGRHYVKHVHLALRFLKPGSTLVAILPASARYDHGDLIGEWRDLPVASFADAGTNVPTSMIKMRAPA